jgi:hypothetical protein
VTATPLSHEEFDLLWEHLGFTERPYPLDVRSFGYTMEERAALRDQVRRSLASRGLHDGAEVAPALEERLAVLGRHTSSIDARMSVGEDLRVLAASRGRVGVLAAQSDDRVVVAPVRDARLVPAVIALLPDRHPGPGGAARLPKAVFDAAVDEFAASGYTGMERVLTSGGVTGRDLRTVVTLLESGRSGGGQLAANRVDQVGRRTRSPVLNWFDTEPGRYLVHGETTRDGVEWLTITPADTARVQRRLTELVEGLNRR